MPLTPEGIFGSFVSPDDRWLTARESGGVISLFPLAGGPRRELRLDPTDSIVGWLKDSSGLLVADLELKWPLPVSRVDIDGGKRTVIATLAPNDPAGVVRLEQVAFAPDGDHYVFNYFRHLSELFIVDGLR
jgi:hypothetical protein